MTGTINVALIGSKFMGRAHSNAWLNVPRFFDVDPRPVMHTVVGRNAADLDAFAARWGWLVATTDWRAAITAPEIGLVDVATPNDVHAEQSIAALEAGKHVVCEKPLAGTLADAEAMAAAAARSRRARPSSGTTTAACPPSHSRTGSPGRVRSDASTTLAPATSRVGADPSTPLVWRFQGDIAGSGAHGDLNAHIIDAVRFVTGEEIVSVEGAIEHTFINERELPVGAAARSPGRVPARPAGSVASTVDDAVMFLARLSGGGLASFEASRLATGYHNANRFEIHGDHGALRFDFERMNELDFYDASGDGATAGWTTIDVTRGGDGHPYAAAWWPDSHGLGYEHGFVNQAADILTMIGGGEPLVPMPDFEDALRTQRVLDAAIRSAREHAPIEVGAGSTRETYRVRRRQT